MIDQSSAECAGGPIRTLRAQCIGLTSQSYSDAGSLVFESTTYRMGHSNDRSHDIDMTCTHMTQVGFHAVSWLYRSGNREGTASNAPV